MGEATPLLAKANIRLNERCPDEIGHWFSKLYFSWLTPLLDLGNHRPLEFDDLYLLNPQDRAVHVFNVFREQWNTQNSIAKPKIFKALAHAFGRQFILAGVLKFVHICSQFVGPLIIKSVIAYLSDPNTHINQGIYYVAAIFFSGILQSFALRQYYFYCYETGLRCRSAIIMAVYSKALKLSCNLQTSTGEIGNLTSIDAQRLQELPNYLHSMWYTTLQMAMAFYCLYVELGVAFLAGAAVMILLLPLTNALSKRMRKLQIQLMNAKDQRVKIAYEALSGIKVVKLQAWENPFMTHIHTKRTHELKCLKSYVFSTATAGVVFNSVPSVVTVASFAAYVYLGYNLDIGTALTSVALFEILRVPLYNIPATINAIVEAIVSFDRLEAFLWLDEKIPVAIGPLEEPGILLQNASFSWQNEVVLSEITMDWNSNNLVAIVGPVGAGKSTLLHGILGDAICSSGSVYAKGSIAYVGQQPFLQNATLRDNITFGLPFEYAKYSKAIQVSCLQADLDILPGGDLTEIGEKGINLSGGQRMRVAIARAVYQDKDIYLLDDPLAAVDSHVGSEIFDKCIKSALKDKLIILVSNALHFLEQCDTIVVLNNGKIMEHGSYVDLSTNSNGVLSSLLKSCQSIAINKTTTKTHSIESTAEATDAAKSMPLTLMTDEDRFIGQVPLSTHSFWIESCGGSAIALLIILSFGIAQASQILCTIWLSIWSEKASEINDKYFLSIYLALNVLTTCFYYSRSILLYIAGLRGSKAVFADVLNHVFRAPMHFFDTTPLGRIINRLSKDVSALDESIPANMNFFLGSIMSLLGAIGMIIVATPWFSLALIPLSIFYYYAQKYYLNASCELQRMDSISRSPVYALLLETLEGLSTIQAFNIQDTYISKQALLLDTNQRAYYLSIASTCWLGLRLEFIGTMATSLAATLAICAPHSVAFAGIAGVSLSYSFSVAQVLNWTVRCLAILQTQMVSIQRLYSYTLLPEEGAWCTDIYDKNWPSKGELVFENVDLQYRSGLPHSLKKLSFQIHAMEKIGIVGRTGAGKSTIIVALMRLVKLDAGRILFDGVDIATIGLHDVRNNISIIPQDPVLFSGSIRSNLDPFGNYDDAMLWCAVKRVHLENSIDALDDKVDERGQNFSVGERQLLCIARALLKKSRIIVMDEATASIDVRTDQLIQQSIRSECMDCTTITIAHRINTILNSDRILVMDKGSVVEFDTPAQLLKKPNGFFAKLAKHWNEDKVED